MWFNYGQPSDSLIERVIRFSLCLILKYWFYTFIIGEYQICLAFEIK